MTVDEGTLEVAHEALLREWPRLRGWLEEDAEGRRLHQHLIDAASEWQAGGRDSGELYRGARLASALEWAPAHEGDLNELERAFLDESRAEAEHEAEHQRRANRRAPCRAGRSRRPAGTRGRGRHRGAQPARRGPRLRPRGRRPASRHRGAGAGTPRRGAPVDQSSRGARRIPGHPRQHALGAAAQSGGDRRAQPRLADVRGGLQPGRAVDRYRGRARRRQRLRRRHSPPGRRALRDRGRPRTERALHAGRRVDRHQLHGPAKPGPQRPRGCDRRPDSEAHAPGEGASAARPAELGVPGRRVPAERSGPPRAPGARLRAGRPGRARCIGSTGRRATSRIGSP